MLVRESTNQGIDKTNMWDLCPMREHEHDAVESGGRIRGLMDGNLGARQQHAHKHNERPAADALGMSCRCAQ
jgi:hypothetical protein